MTIIWCMVPGMWSMTDRIFVILDHFLPFYPTKNLKNQHFEKMKKMSGDIILHKCTKNHYYMLSCSWDTMCDICNSYFLFWAIFCPFTLLTTQKIKILGKWRKCLEISLFYTCVPKIMITWSMVPKIWYMKDRWTDGQMDGWIEVGAPPKKSKECLKKCWKIRNPFCFLKPFVYVVGTPKMG